MGSVSTSEVARHIRSDRADVGGGCYVGRCWTLVFFAKFFVGELTAYDRLLVTACNP